jgi:uncharacterized protein (UPF0276 family)
VSRAGIGLGLRWSFADELLERRPPEVDFLEVAPENYLGRGGWARRVLERSGAAYPLISHGLSLGLGGSVAFDARTLREIRALVTDIGAGFHSDHLSLTGDGDRFVHELLPLRLSRETAIRTAVRVRQVQDALGVPMAVENVSAYARLGESTLEEGEFLAEVCARAGCGWLFDVNNAWVNAENFGTDLEAFLRTAPLERVVQIHLAGPTPLHDPEHGTLLVDTHGAATPDPVLALFARVIARTGPVPVVLERDLDVPPLDELLAEVRRVRAVYETALPISA